MGKKQGTSLTSKFLPLRFCKYHLLKLTVIISCLLILTNMQFFLAKNLTEFGFGIFQKKYRIQFSYPTYHYNCTVEHLPLRFCKYHLLKLTVIISCLLILTNMQFFLAKNLTEFGFGIFQKKYRIQFSYPTYHYNCTVEQFCSLQIAGHVPTPF